jgi:hypothetical protein
VSRAVATQLSPCPSWRAATSVPASTVSSESSSRCIGACSSPSNTTIHPFTYSCDTHTHLFSRLRFLSFLPHPPTSLGRLAKAVAVDNAASSRAHACEPHVESLRPPQSSTLDSTVALPPTTALATATLDPPDKLPCRQRFRSSHLQCRPTKCLC